MMIQSDLKGPVRLSAILLFGVVIAFAGDAKPVMTVLPVADKSTPANMMMNEPPETRHKGEPGQKRSTSPFSTFFQLF